MSLRRAEPHSDPMTFLAGHPILMSMPAIPVFSSFLPASLKNSGSLPKS